MKKARRCQCNICKWRRRMAAERKKAERFIKKRIEEIERTGIEQDLVIVVRGNKVHGRM